MNSCHDLLTLMSVAFGCALLPTVSTACIIDDRSTQQSLDLADAVFVGTVAAVHPRPAPVERARFGITSSAPDSDATREAVAIVRVDRGFKGVPEQIDVNVQTYSEGAYACFPWQNLKSGQTALLFASRLESGEFRVERGLVPLDGKGGDASLLRELQRLKERIRVEVQNEVSNDFYTSAFADVVRGAFVDSSQFTLELGEAQRVLIVSIPRPVKSKTYPTGKTQISYDIQFTSQWGEQLGAANGSYVFGQESECAGRIFEAAAAAAEGISQ